MYKTLIEQINPKPKFNLTWYKNEDSYSEGDVEDLLIKLIAENEPEQYVDAIYENFNWSTYYHLTHMRRNILNWYDFKADGDVLEIGCGLGAITSLLCEKCNSVTAVELSKKRATATLLRCREKENLEIIVGNLNDIEFEKKYDYITLIGVLEYQGKYTDTKNPFADFLKNIKMLLKPNGKLLIAIENQYGLKYWCGAPEDHLGIPFEGMNQYSSVSRGVRTFSKVTLEKLLKDSGYKNIYFYYPMPDYKVPTVIYSEKCLPKNANMQNMRCYYIPDKSTIIADEEGMYKDIIENDVFEFFANSFLVECSDVDDVGRITFTSTASERKSKYQIATRFTAEGKVEKIPLTDECTQGHLRQILKNEQMMAKSGRKIWNSSWEENKLVSDFVDAPLLEDVALKAVEDEEQEKFFEVFDWLYKEILSSSEEVNWQENILYELEGVQPDKEAYGPVLRIGFLDMILRNAFYIDEEVYWFDQEWILEAVPAKYILYRAINQLYLSYPEVDRVCPFLTLCQRYEIDKIYKQLKHLDSLFVQIACDTKQLQEARVFGGTDKKICEENIKKLLSR